MAAGKLVITEAEGGDEADLAALLLACDRFYAGEQPGAEAGADEAARRLLGGDSGCRALIAREGGKPVAFATFSVMQASPSSGDLVFMKDLFVAEAARGGGLGEALMAAVARIALALGCRRLDWAADSANGPALAFYDRLGASRIEKVYFRLEDQDLEIFAETRG